jgi:hypothetical protein
VSSEEDVQNINALRAFNAEFPNREPIVKARLEPGAGEEDVMRVLRAMLPKDGPAGMVKWGGWWRCRTRDNKRAVIDVIWDAQIRLKEGKDFRNLGGWMRHQFGLHNGAKHTLGAGQ